jgi:hypothetical protein
LARGHDGERGTAQRQSLPALAPSGSTVSPSHSSLEPGRARRTRNHHQERRSSAPCAAVRRTHTAEPCVNPPPAGTLEGPAEGRKYALRAPRADEVKEK